MSPFAPRIAKIVTPLCLAFSVALPAQAGEGMWTLDNLPLARLKQAYDFQPTPAWVAKVMKSSARLAGGCSASFISPGGLVMTNHHCVAGCVAQLSTGASDLMRSGFLAREATEERRCPAMELNRLELTTDVTDKVNAATAGKSGYEFQQALTAVTATLTSECQGAGEGSQRLRCDMVTLYQGGQYQLYRYHRYSDVRLAWAPEAAIASFGGDPDNFNFPRYDLDAAFVRAYEDGKPARIDSWFTFNPRGAEPGELTITAGNPGRTQRALTSTELETLRQTLSIDALPRMSELRGLMSQMLTEGPEAQRLASAQLQWIENTIKVMRGELRTLSDPAVFAAKQRYERELQAFIAARPELKAKVGDPWADIARAEAAETPLRALRSTIEGYQPFGSAYFGHARRLVRAAAERAKPNDQRLPEFSDSALQGQEQAVASPAPIYPAMERVMFGWGLTKMRETLGSDDEIVKRVLGRESPAQFADRLIAGTKMGDPAERLRLWRGGQAAIDASTDPYIQLAKLIDPDARAVRRRYETEVSSVQRRATERIAMAAFAQTGRNAYPDATFSLRLSFGEVAGWTERGQPVAPYTEMGGTFRRATGAAPYELPASWTRAADRVSAAQRFNFVTTNDVIGGNSGSPMINRAGEVIGLVFDGNEHSLGGAFIYDPALNRTVAVHAGAIIESLTKVYGANALVDEILAPRQAAAVNGAPQAAQ